MIETDDRKWARLKKKYIPISSQWGASNRTERSWAPNQGIEISAYLSFRVWRAESKEKKGKIS